MSTRKSARQYFDIDSQTQKSTTSIFVKNHANPQHLLKQLNGLFNAGSLEEVHHVIECIIDGNNSLISSAEIFILHAKVYIESNGFNVHARCAIQQALLLEPNHPEALALQQLARASEELRDGLYESAEQSLRTTLTKDGQNAYASYLLGNHLFWKNGPETEAIELLEKCVKIRPSFLKAWLCLAMAYKKNRNMEKAESAFQQCLALDTNDTNKDFYKRSLQSL